MNLKKLKTSLKMYLISFIMYVSHIFNIQETFKEKIFSFNQCHKIVRYDILLQKMKRKMKVTEWEIRHRTYFHSIHKFVITKMDVTSPKDKILLKNGKFCTRMYSSSSRICQVHNHSYLCWEYIRTLTLPGRFGMAGMKLGWMGKMARQS